MPAEINRSAEIKHDWLRFLGKAPGFVPPLKKQTLSSEKVEGCIRGKIVYYVHERCTVEAYLIRPEDISGRRPGIISFHQTIECNIDESAGIDGCSDLHIGMHLAKCGYVTLSPRCFLWDYHGKKRPASVQMFMDDFPGWKGMGKMLWDGMRAVDVLSSLDYVDKNKIGAIGHSLGGKEAFYLAAFDKRIKLSVSSEMGIGLNMSNWNDAHYLGPEINDPGFKLNHENILALIPPTPFLLIAGGCTDGDESEIYINNAKKIYSIYGAEENILFLNHHQQYKFPPAAGRTAYDWITEHLGAVCNH